MLRAGTRAGVSERGSPRRPPPRLALVSGRDHYAAEITQCCDLRGLAVVAGRERMRGMPREIHGANNDDPLLRLEELIAACLPALARPQLPAPEYVTPKRSITAGEAAGFFAAVDAGLFELTLTGMCQPRLMRPSTGYGYPLLIWPSRAQNRVVVWREWLTHAAAPLILGRDYCYPFYDMALDVDAFDLLVYSPLNQPYIAVEVKKTSVEVDAMLAGIRTVQEQPFALGVNRLSNAEQKFRGLLALRPVYFLALAPDSQRAFKVRFPDDPAIPAARLEEIERVPDALT
jgi:hypothetical protein